MNKDTETINLYWLGVMSAEDEDRVAELAGNNSLVLVTARPVRFQGGVSFAMYPCRVGDEADGYVVDAADVDE